MNTKEDLGVLSKVAHADDQPKIQPRGEKMHFLVLMADGGKPWVTQKEISM